MRCLGAGDGASTGERGIVAVGLGAGLLQFVPVGLGYLQVLGPTSLRVAIGVLGLLLAYDLAGCRRGYWHLRHFRRPSIWLAAWILALAPVVAVALLIALVPTVDTDGVVYHLTAKRWLASGSLEYLPTYPQSNSPMGVEMLYAMGMVFAGDTAAKCLHMALGVLAAATLYLCGRRIAGPVVGAIAATFYLVGPVGIGGALGTAYTEGVATFGISAAALAWLVWFGSRDRGWLRCAAVWPGSPSRSSSLLPFFRWHLRP